MANKKQAKRFSLTPDSTNLLHLSSIKGQEIGEQFTMNLLGLPQQAMDLPEKEKKEVFLISIEIFKKLSKLANATDKYVEEEKEIVAEFKRRIKNGEKRIAHHSDVLEGAMEEVVGQAKSTLDVTVKLLKPLYGLTAHTYGKNGEKVINSLKRNVPVNDQGKIKAIIDIIEQFKPYSKPIIKLRTDSQHYGNIKMTPLIVEIGRNSKPKVTLPEVFEGHKAKDFVEIVYHNIFTFTRDFMTFSFASLFYKGLVPVIMEEKGERIKKIGVSILKSAIKE